MPNEQRSLKVFLCHAHSDKNAVHDLYQCLIEDGVDAWLDKEKLLPGQDWELEIRKAVGEADVVVVCLSKQFNQAGFRQKEVRLALETAMEQPEGEIFIIPARLEECDTLENLRKWHWVDLFDEDGYEILMRALRARANKIGAALQTKKSWLPRTIVPTKDEKKIAEDRLVETKPEKPKEISKPAIQKTKRKPNTAIMVALIGFAGTIIAGLLSSPLLEKWFSPAPAITESATVTFTLTFPAVTSSTTIEPSQTLTKVPTSRLTSTVTATPTVTLMPIVTSLPKGYTMVPDVVGKKYSSAESILKNSGFKVQYAYVVRPDTSAGLIVEQTPQKGTSFKTGETVLLKRTMYATPLQMDNPIEISTKAGDIHYFTYKFLGGNSYAITVTAYDAYFEWEFTIALLDLDLHQIDVVSRKMTLIYSPSQSDHAVISVSNCCYGAPGLKTGVKVTQLH